MKIKNSPITKTGTNKMPVKTKLMNIKIPKKGDKIFIPKTSLDQIHARVGVIEEIRGSQDAPFISTTVDIKEQKYPVSIYFHYLSYNKEYEFWMVNDGV